MGLFGKKGKSRDELIAEAAELNDQPAQEEKKEEVSTGNQKIDIELTKISGRLEGLDEVRKATSERFSRIAEQIGELRGMIVDTNKAMSKVEVSSTKAVDLVESVHPEKLMIDVRKQDGKLEALRANIESNEAIMKDLMLELKKMRDKMSFYKGIEQVIQLNEEIKKELATIKRVEAKIEQHADKVETVFIEVEKKFSDFDKFNDVVKDLDKSFKRLQSDFEKIRTKVEVKLDRKEFVDLLDRFNEFEKHTTNLLKLLDERNKTVKDEVSAQFRRLLLEYKKKLDAMRPVLKPKEAPAPKEEKTEEPETGGDGEDTAGDDVKPGFKLRLKEMFGKIVKKKETEPVEEEEMFPDEAQEQPSGEKPAGGEPPKEGEKPTEKKEEPAKDKTSEGKDPSKEGEKPAEGKDEPPKEKPAEGESSKDKPQSDKPEEKPAENEKPAEKEEEKKPDEKPPEEKS